MIFSQTKIMTKDADSLPSLNKMRFPAYRTLKRGVRIGENDINVKQDFSDVMIDQVRLQSYKEFFNFSSEFPFSFFYILAQRAQLSVMLNKEFTIAIPGLIHLNNNLEILTEVDFESQFNIEVQGKVNSKTSGSLFPNFDVKFLQNGKIVAKCSSGYLAKRKKKSKSDSTGKKETNIPIFNDAIHSETWELSKSLGKSYGKVSGDSNPIHTSKLFAKFAGFKRPIIQGWYSASRVIQSANSLIQNISSIEVHFNKPIYLPSSVQLDLFKQTDELYNFNVNSPNEGLTHLYGLLKT